MSSYGNVFEDWRHPPTMGLRCTFGAGAFRSVRGARVLSSAASGPAHCGRRNSLLAPRGAWHTPRQPAATRLAGYSTRGRNLTSYQARSARRRSTAALMKKRVTGEGPCRLFTERACHKVSDLSRLRVLPESLNQSVWFRVCLGRSSMNYGSNQGGQEVNPLE